jgi:hypothetical protein
VLDLGLHIAVPGTLVRGGFDDNPMGAALRRLNVGVCSMLAMEWGGVSVAVAQTAVSVNPEVKLPSLGQLATPDPYHEFETKYIFGFTEGADIGAEGERAIELETTTELGLRTGTYGILEQELEFEGVPTQYFGYDLSAHGLGFSVSNVDGMADDYRRNFVIW